MLQQAASAEPTTAPTSSSSAGAPSVQVDSSVQPMDIEPREDVSRKRDRPFEMIEEELQDEQEQRLRPEDMEWIVDMPMLTCIQGELVSAVQKLTLPYRDSVTGEVLDEKQTLEGMRLELQNLADFGVFKPATRQQAADAGKHIVGTRWVLRNKGDRVKARVVAQELNRGEFKDTFAAAPSALVTRLVLWQCVRSPNFVCATLDVSAAFLHAPMDEDMFCECSAGSPATLVGESGEIVQALKVLYDFQTSPGLFQ
jgi:hypothetical protein